MCEILLRVVDRISSDFYKNCQLTKSGDVIIVQGDGWGWSREERSNPDWRIMAFPGISVDIMRGFLAPQSPTDPLNPEKTLLARAVKFDVTKIALLTGIGPNAVTIISQVNDATRTTPTIAFPVAVTSAAPCAVTKARVADPAILGQTDSKIIG